MFLIESLKNNPRATTGYQFKLLPLFFGWCCLFCEAYWTLYLYA